MGTVLCSAVAGGYNEVSTTKYSTAEFCYFGIICGYSHKGAETNLGSPPRTMFLVSYVPDLL